MLHAVTVLAVVSGCSPSNDRADARRASNDADAARPDSGCGEYNPWPGLGPPSMSACCPEPMAHVDCFGAVSCSGSAVVVDVYAPIYTCTNERARQLLADNVCARLGRTLGVCPQGTACRTIFSTEPISDARYPACQGIYTGSRIEHISSGQLAAFWRLSCTDGGPSVGSACSGDEHCRPAPASVRGQLRCVSGRCAETHRRAPQQGFGESCAPSRAPLGASPTCATCVTPMDGCGAFCSQECVFDEDCPASFVCAYAGGYCGGACVPEGHRAAFRGGAEPGGVGGFTTAGPYPNCGDGGASADAAATDR